LRVRKTFLRQNQKRLDQQAAEPAIEKPLVKIKIYNKTYYALLDSGSNVSVLGSNVFAELKAKNAPTWYANKSLEMLDGSIKITGRAQVPVHTIEGKIEHQFYSVNDSSNQIILGMDYMAKAKIGISPLGWFKTKTPYKLNKFVKDYNETLYCNKLSCAAQGYSASLAPARSSDIYVITEQLGENSFALAPIKGRKKRVVANADQLQIFTQRHAQN